MIETDEKLNIVWWLMRLGLGVGMFLAGLDKFFDLLTTWSMYLSPLAERLLPVAPETFLRAVGVVEMGLGFAIVTRWTKAGAYAMCGWMIGVALNLALAAHFWDLVVRDLELALSAFALARLTTWRTATIAAFTPPAVSSARLRQEAHT
jgi:uncharacterized membrane protein YphA (DoxX/SURF4 family)